MLRKIRHIGVVVEHFERAIEKFSGFGLPCNEVSEIQEFGIKVAFLRSGDSLIELIYYTDPDKRQSGIVGRQKGPLNHICFEVDDLERTIQDFERKGARIVQGYPRAGAHGRVAFFYPETTEGVLIEICQV
jgi:methylmalonyl-CoA/ethylmalonyl-CoA epimerase